MDLRLPDSGSIVAAVLNGLGGPSTVDAGGMLVPQAGPAQLDEALAALTRGDIEYVILEDGERFAQAAGDGDGPYQVQISDGGQMQEMAGGVDVETMRAILHAYLADDPAWQRRAWTPMR